MFIGFVPSLLCSGNLLCALTLCLLLCRGFDFVSFVELLSGDSGNSSRGEVSDVEQVAQTSKHIFVFAFSISQLYLFMSYIAIIAYSYILDIVLTLVLIQESY